MKLLMSFLGLWITPIAMSEGVIQLPEFGHQIPAALIGRFVKGGGVRVRRYRSAFNEIAAEVHWRGNVFEYYTDDWGGAQISGDAMELDSFFEAMSRSRRTRTVSIG